MARVDYDRVAATYGEGRGPVADAELWQAAVTPYLPTDTRRLRVLDLGAGTGIFVRAWPTWGATEVVAVEPSWSMLQEARGDLPGRARLVNAGAEALPLRPASIDAAWLSTVFHHFADRGRAVAELGRVLTAVGVVLIRAHFPDQGSSGWFENFPGAARALRRFSTLSDVRALFAAGGFVLRDLSTVMTGQGPATACANFARRMRHADTFLSALTPDEFTEGLARLDAVGDAPLDRPALQLAVFARHLRR